MYIASVSSKVPAKDVPKGAVQLKVKTPDEKIFHEDLVSGSVALWVKQVLNGKFSDPIVRLNISNLGRCDTMFDRPDGDFFITVVPLEYSDGEPVLDREGSQQFGSLLYRSEYPPFVENKVMPKFAEYHPMTAIDLSFHDPVRMRCLTNGNNEDVATWPADAWRRCVGPGEYVALDCEQKEQGKLVCKEDDYLLKNRPIELRRGYGFWARHRTTISSILLALGLLVGFGYFFRSRKLRTS